MAVHARQAIRAAAKAQLLGKTAAADRVIANRIVPWREKELPGIAVYTLDTEHVDPESWKSAPRELLRRMPLAIEAVALASADLDDVLDALALDIERAIAADDTLGGTASDAFLESTETTLDANGEQLIGRIRLVFLVTYVTNAPDAADETLVDLKTVDVKYDLGRETTPPGTFDDDTFDDDTFEPDGGGQDPANQAEDVVDNLNR